MSLTLCLAGVAASPGSADAACTPPTTAGDPSYCSTNYGIVESELGATGDFNSASTNFRNEPLTDDSGSTLGGNFIGNSGSTSFQTNSGFNTTAQPGLTVCVGATGTSCADMAGTSVDLGNLSTTVASTATSKFSVKNYTSNGYAVTVIGGAPANSGDPLTNLATQTASSAGTEQFGINLRDNASPADVGTDPVAIPSSTFSLSDPNTVVDANYRTADQYRYNSGDRIALAPQSSGETTYTISYLANISNVTPGGRYTGGLSIVVTGTY